MSTPRAHPAARMLRVRRLVMGDVVPRGAALRHEAEQCERFARLLTPPSGDCAVGHAHRIMAELSGSGMRVTFDEWAARQRPEGGPDRVQVYRTTWSCCAE